MVRVFPLFISLAGLARSRSAPIEGSRATSWPAERAVLAYAKADAGLNTGCDRPIGTGQCWDLAACAIYQKVGIIPWNCGTALLPHNESSASPSPPSTLASSPEVGGGRCGAEGRDDYKVRPLCYLWGQEVAAPGGNWDNVWNPPAMGSFVTQGVQPGDILQFDNYVATCNGTVYESTGGGPHTAVIIAVRDKTLEVCHQHWGGVEAGVCGFSFFTWYDACLLNGTKTHYSFDALKIYRPASTSTGGSRGCTYCRSLLSEAAFSAWFPAGLL
jgi:hypothetical protein